MVDASEVKAVQALVEKLKSDPTLVYAPELSFFKDFLQSWNAQLPQKPAETKPPKSPTGQPKEAPKPAEPEEESEEEPEEPEEPEEEDPERMAEDAGPFPEKSPAGELELSDAQLDKQGDAKQAAAEALEDGDLAKALAKYTEAIVIGNATAMMYAKRAEILLKLKKPCACISDCDAALAINPDSAKAYRTRGKAHRYLGHWEDAHKDVAMAQQLDFDDSMIDMQKFLGEKHKKSEERKVQQRIRDEKKKLKQRKKDKERAVREYEEQKRREAAGMGGMPGGMPDFSGMGGMPGMGGMGGMPGMGGMGGMPGMPPGFDMNMMQGLMSDPELMAAFSDPTMRDIMMDIMSNPANISKYENDPRVKKLQEKLMSKFGGMGGMPGGFGGMGGGPGGASAASGPTVEEVNEDADCVD